MRSGWGLGEHGIWCKYTNFENQVRVPLLVRVPWLPQIVGKHSNALVELVDIFQTLASLAGITANITDVLEGSDFSPVLTAGGIAPSNWRTAAFSQYPRCMNSTKAQIAPYTPNREPCCGHPANEFTHMGLSVRTAAWRYTEWRRWDGTICEPDWSADSSPAIAGVELYSHEGDITPACFDCFENVNVQDKYPNIVATHAKLIRKQFQKPAHERTGCPVQTDADRQSAIQIFTEGYEDLPAEITSGE